MNEIFKDQNAIDDILYRTKEQYNPGAMKSRIYTVVEERGRPISELRLQWLFYSGMGDFYLHDHWAENEKEATTHLIHEGRLVPTTIENHYNVMKIQRIKHIDDVNWAKLDDGRIVMYELAGADHFDDELIVPTGLQLNGVKLLEKRMGYGLSIGKVWEDSDSITLKNGTQVTPIWTTREMAHLRLRQKGMPLPK